MQISEDRKDYLKQLLGTIGSIMESCKLDHAEGLVLGLSLVTSVARQMEIEPELWNSIVATLNEDIFLKGDE